MTQLQNQFELAREKGQLVLSSNTTPHSFNCQVVSTESGTLTPGQAVVLSDTAGEQILVEAASAIDDDIFGFVPYAVETNEYVALDQIKVAGKQAVMLMEASAAIARGADVEIVLSGNKVATADTGTVIGRCLDKAAADGDLVRVEITV